MRDIDPVIAEIHRDLVRLLVEFYGKDISTTVYAGRLLTAVLDRLADDTKSTWRRRLRISRDVARQEWLP